MNVPKEQEELICRQLFEEMKSPLTKLDVKFIRFEDKSNTFQIYNKWPTLLKQFVNYPSDYGQH